MSRALTVQPKVGSLPWRAHPSEETTVAELERALSMFKIDLVRTTADEILLVQNTESIRDGEPPPKTEDLARIMFGHDDAVLVEETGAHKKLDGDRPVG